MFIQNIQPLILIFKGFCDLSAEIISFIGLNQVFIILPVTIDITIIRMRKTLTLPIAKARGFLDD